MKASNLDKAEALEVLESVDWNIGVAAPRLGVVHTTLRNYLAKWGVDRKAVAERESKQPGRPTLDEVRARLGLA